MLRGVGPREALDRLRSAADDGRLDALCERSAVRVLGAFGSATQPATQPGDLDIAVGFLDEPRELELLDGLIQLAGDERMDLLVIDRADPVARAAAFIGVPLFEHAAGVYAVEQMAAFAEKRDTTHLRHLDLRALAE